MQNYDYLKWDAQSIQELLRRKLLESGVLTDQLYPASDTKILIDLFAWTFDVLTYMLNNAASDVLFSDTQLYENMNRLVKLLSYKPHGYLTSSAEFEIKFNSQSENKLSADNCMIPKFSSISTGLTDKNGNTVKYSFVDDFSFNVYRNQNGVITLITPNKWPKLYNGEFKKYETPFFATSYPYETFILDGINPDNLLHPIFVDHNHFHIYIEHINENTGHIEYTEWKQVDNLALNSTYNSQHYELRLDENKNYNITFGDNIHGAMLNKGDKIHVIYLQSNCEDGKIDSNQINENTLSLIIDGFFNSTELINICFGGFSNFKQNYSTLFINNGLFIETCNLLSFTNINESSTPQNYETVESIRQNTPSAFRIGGRLVTEDDYKTYILTKFKNRVHDIYVCNNAKYTTEFYQWLKQYGKLSLDIRKYYYRFADACDFNNIYIWVKPTYSGNITDSDLNEITNECNKIKTATAELVPCSVFETYFIPYINHPDYIINISNMLLTADWNPPIKLVIEKKPGALISNEQLTEQINKIFIDYFAMENQKLGNVINISEIYQKILDTGYVEKVKTRYVPVDDPNNIYEINGLSMACYTPTVINGLDFEVFQYSKKLNKFQFAKFYANNIFKLIEIENKEMYNVNNIRF